MARGAHLHMGPKSELIPAESIARLAIGFSMMFQPAGAGSPFPLGPLLRRSNTSTAAPSRARCAAHSMPPGPPPTMPTVLPASTCGLTTLGAVLLVARRRVGTDERAGVDRDGACGA